MDDWCRRERWQLHAAGNDDGGGRRRHGHRCAGGWRRHGGLATTEVRKRAVGAWYRARQSHSVGPWEDAASEVARCGNEVGGGMRQESGDNIEGEKKTPRKRKGNDVGSVFHISTKFLWLE